MPAELFPAVLIGGGSLLWAAIRSRAHWKLIGWGFGIAVAMFLLLIVIPEVTGLADGTTAIGGWQWMLVLGLLMVYALAVAVTGVGGILLVRDLFKPGQWAVRG
jgi:hypothetical protein